MKDVVGMNNIYVYIYNAILDPCQDQCTYVNANVVVERTATKASRKDKVNDML